VNFITEHIGFIALVAGIVVAGITSIAVIAWIAYEPEPVAGMGDQPAWLRNGEEERGPHGDY
jgi:hypothetical protein